MVKFRKKKKTFLLGVRPKPMSFSQDHYYYPTHSLIDLKKNKR